MQGTGHAVYVVHRTCDFPEVSSKLELPALDAFTLTFLVFLINFTFLIHYYMTGIYNYFTGQKR